MSRVNRYMLLIGVSIDVILFDLLTKNYALNHFLNNPLKFGPVTFSVIYNRGTAFGLGVGIMPILLGVGAECLFGLLEHRRIEVDNRGDAVPLAEVLDRHLAGLHHGGERFTLIQSESLRLVLDAVLVCLRFAFRLLNMFRFYCKATSVEILSDNIDIKDHNLQKPSGVGN